MRKAFLRTLLVLLCLIVVVLIGLFVNHALYQFKYSRTDTRAEQLGEEEILQVKSVYEYLLRDGNTIMPGFDGKNIDLILFNDAYEFLICSDSNLTGWSLIGFNEVLQKNIHRRPANDPQAFAVYTADRWVGSMATMDTFNKSIFETMTSQTGVLGYLLPPQFFNADSAFFEGMVIHEMLHAFQATANESRLVEASKISNVCQQYYDDSTFTGMIESEGEHLQKALEAENQDDILRYTKLFLDTRDERRSLCHLSSTEIFQEKEFEWLEGMARYAEYLSSSDSKSTIRADLDKTGEKAKVQSDDRYYSMGMAEALILDKLGVEWKSEAFTDTFYFEEALRQVIQG